MFAHLQRANVRLLTLFLLLPLWVPHTSYLRVGFLTLVSFSKVSSFPDLSLVPF
jgi:hypothetical protein